MERINTSQLCEIILTAPAWARVGITMPDENMRLKAANELACAIADQLSVKSDMADPSQLPLPL